jgi:ATP-dependent Clp protease ATP-binding subunit ClpC
MNWLKSFWKELTTPKPPEWDGNLESLRHFTPRGLHVLRLAQTEAMRLNHSFVDTEHLLLGVIQLREGVAVNALKRMGIELEKVRLEIERQVRKGDDRSLSSEILFTPRAKLVVALTVKEARALHHFYIGTEHILMALLDENEGAAAHVLKNLGVEMMALRREIENELDPNFGDVNGDAHNPK